jgi:UDP-glucose 4-epimerase
MPVLVTGGAGYIGSHVTYALLERGETVIVVDNLTSGLRNLVSPDAIFTEGDVGDREMIIALMHHHNIDSVIHFAGSLIVPESVERPLAYYANNTSASRNLIEAAIATGVRDFIFSSTAAVYGIPTEIPVNEETPVRPINPYGRSKLATEWILHDSSDAHGLRYMALRYFNVAGADPQGRTGQSTHRATHLIKRACQVALGRRPFLEIFGTDYPTPDGTCVRDYIHVTDLAKAHVLALDGLRKGALQGIYNCGYGRGFSVRDVIASVEQASGRKIAANPAPRRVGDPPSLIADSTKIKNHLGWIPEYDDLHFIVETALRWEQNLPVRVSP